MRPNIGTSGPSLQPFLELSQILCRRLATSFAPLNSPYPGSIPLNSATDTDFRLVVLLRSLDSEEWLWKRVPLRMD